MSNVCADVVRFCVCRAFVRMFVRISCVRAKKRVSCIGEYHVRLGIYRSFVGIRAFVHISYVCCVFVCVYVYCVLTLMHVSCAFVCRSMYIQP